MSQEYPRWGRDKLAVLLKREGITISGSTVGRERARLKARGLLLEPENVRRAKLARKRRRKPRYATKMPRGYRAQAPGDLVEVSTLRVSLLPTEERFYFSAWDKVTRLVGMKTYKRQTSTAAADFLYHLRTKFPFPIKAIQIDGGSEFMDQFEEACYGAEILLFQNPLPASQNAMEGWRGATGPTGKSSMKSRTYRSTLKNITSNWPAMNMTITISGPTGPWNSKLLLSIMSSGRKFINPRCHQCPELIQYKDYQF